MPLANAGLLALALARCGNASGLGTASGWTNTTRITILARAKYRRRAWCSLLCVFGSGGLQGSSWGVLCFASVCSLRRLLLAVEGNVVLAPLLYS